MKEKGRKGNLLIQRDLEDIANKKTNTIHQVSRKAHMSDKKPESDKGEITECKTPGLWLCCAEGGRRLVL